MFPEMLLVDDYSTANQITEDSLMSYLQIKFASKKSQVNHFFCLMPERLGDLKIMMIILFIY